ncbi:MAG: methyltransferase [Gemmatimonadota bacterium]
MSESVARYYDRNTRRFLLVGRGADTHSIHRELWPPGVASAREAARYVDRLIADEIEATADGPVRTIFDFGCGVGGTLFYLAERFADARLQGVTISPKQVQIAERLLAQNGLAERCAIEREDFHSVQLGLQADAIVAVESLAHSDDVDAFLSNVAHHLAPGGVLLVADDFLAAEETSFGPGQRRGIARFRAGWRLPGLGTVESLAGRASAHGLSLRTDVDLSSYTRPGYRIRDAAIRLSSPLLERLGLIGVPFFGNVIGGNALQSGLKSGTIHYRLLVFAAHAQRTSTPNE